MTSEGYLELDPAREDPIFLSTMPAGPAQRRHALIAVIVAIAVFLAAVPFVRVQLPPSPAFISIHESALLVITLITAVLLFGQFAILRSRAMLVLAAGYLYAAVMTIPHVLAFPGVLTPTGLLGGGPQTSAWLYVFWRVGYEVSLITYVVLSSWKPAAPLQSARVAIVSSVAIVVALTGLLTLIVRQADSILPALQNDGRYTHTTLTMAMISLLVGVIFLLWFWRRGAKSVLDLWLLVVIFMLLLAAILSSVLNTGRFDFGFVFGRLFGLAAASFVLINLLIQNSRLYAKLAAGQAELQRLTRVDPLTGIANRRAFDLAIETEWRRAMRNRTSLSLLLADVDSFKSFNDIYGHPAGDDCLRAVAEVLVKTARRAGETVARCGGEEFTVLLPGVDRAEASTLAQRLCQTVRDLNIPHAASSVAPHVTISAGVATAFPARDPDPWAPGPDGLVERADRALYAAKAAGRDQVAEDGPAAADGQRSNARYASQLSLTPWSRWRGKPL
jgi:diguanylate cyclase (GGDEF)-like protein